MRYKLLGKSGLRVSQLALGAMTFGEEWGIGAPREVCRRPYEAYRTAGGNFIDTADKYTDGCSEQIVGELIAPERDQIVLATKYSLTANPDDPEAATTASAWYRRLMRASNGLAPTTSTCIGCMPGTTSRR
jgi:aryl-alcohol dehydrogenase-like predicted oxidoreductase